MPIWWIVILAIYIGTCLVNTISSDFPLFSVRLLVCPLFNMIKFCFSWLNVAGRYNYIRVIRVLVLPIARCDSTRVSLVDEVRRRTDHWPLYNGGSDIADIEPPYRVKCPRPVKKNPPSSLIVHSIRDVERTYLLEQRGMSDGVEGLAKVNGQDNDV